MNIYKVWTKIGVHELTFKEWVIFDHRLFHRTDGPAVERSDGTKEWFIDGKKNRLDGPAVEWWNGITDWWINGKLLNTAKIETWIDENNIDLKTEKDQLAFILRWL